MMLNEAKTSRPRPKFRGQSYKAETEARTMRPRSKIIMKKYQILIINI